jgi:transcriptional/translational regulatory protein YebC/TACO1
MEIALENGAEDIKTEEEYFEVLCGVSDYDTLANALEKSGVEADSSELAYVPNNTVAIGDEETARKVLRMVERLEDLEDVKSVFGNYDISEEMMGKIGEE